MNKVKLTQEQARMFENHKYAVEELLKKRVCDNCPTSIDDMPIDDVVKAIAYGYEVEPEYEEGDWVIYNGKVVQIVGITKGYSPITPHEINFAIDDDDWYDYQKIERHATPEEIAEEKERRWWIRQDKVIDKFRQQNKRYREAIDKKFNEFWKACVKVVGEDTAYDIIGELPEDDED